MKQISWKNFIETLKTGMFYAGNFPASKIKDVDNKVIDKFIELWRFPNRWYVSGKSNLKLEKIDGTYTYIQRKGKVFLKEFENALVYLIFQDGQVIGYIKRK